MRALRNFILGGQGIAATADMLAGLTREGANRRFEPLPYRVYRLLWHIELCQRLMLDGLRSGGPVAWPPSAEQWPQEEADEATFQALLTRLRAGLREAADLASDPDALPSATRDTLEDLCAHNAYHWGQVVTLRRLLNDWPAG